MRPRRRGLNGSRMIRVAIRHSLGMREQVSGTHGNVGVPRDSCLINEYKYTTKLCLREATCDETFFSSVSGGRRRLVGSRPRRT